MSTRAKLKASYDAAYAALSRYDTQELEKKNRSLVGQCFRFHNSGDDEREWWLYSRIDAVEGNVLRGLSFQTDLRRDEITIEPNDAHHFSLTEGYQPISRREFDEAWRAVQKRVAGIG